MMRSWTRRLLGMASALILTAVGFPLCLADVYKRQDKGWIFNEECLVNAINFQRDGYDAITLYLDDITFGKETKPVDPNNPITKLEAAIDELPAYDDLTVLDLEKIETVWVTYNGYINDNGNQSVQLNIRLGF